MNTTWLHLSDSEFDRLIRKATKRQIVIFEESAWVLMQKKLDSFFNGKYNDSKSIKI